MYIDPNDPENPYGFHSKYNNNVEKVDSSNC